MLASAACVLTSLNLESNSISSNGVEALARALTTNVSLQALKLPTTYYLPPTTYPLPPTTYITYCFASLQELKLTHQHIACSQAAEFKLAAALATNTTLVRLGLEVRATNARHPNLTLVPKPQP